MTATSSEIKYAACYEQKALGGAAIAAIDGQEQALPLCADCLRIMTQRHVPAVRIMPNANVIRFVEGRQISEVEE